MDDFVVRTLNLTPRSHEQLHTVLETFEHKWQDKARRVLKDDRRSGF